MARRATGAIIERTGADGTVHRSLRFTAYGKRRREPLGPASRTEAERALRGVLADVERGTWKPPEPPPPEPEGMPTLHEFAEQWWLLNEGQLRPSTRVDYRWRLERHFFAEYRLDAITPVPEATAAERRVDGRLRIGLQDSCHLRNGLGIWRESASTSSCRALPPAAAPRAPTRSCAPKTARACSTHISTRSPPWTST